MTITRTYTRTYARLNAWASTMPWACTQAGHWHTPRVDQPCAVDDCRKPLKAREEVYYVVELPRVDGVEPAVCWRHVRPDHGPIVVEPVDGGEGGN